jgi:hypothetical protein
MLLINFLELRAVAARGRKMASHQHAVSCRHPAATLPWPWKVAFRKAYSWHGRGTAWYVWIRLKRSVQWHRFVNRLNCRKFSGRYKTFTRKAPTDFELLIYLVGPKIVKRDTKCRTAILVQERLAVTLRFWATGNSYTRLQYLLQISKQTVSSQIAPEVCQAVVE